MPAGPVMARPGFGPVFDSLRELLHDRSELLRALSALTAEAIASFKDVTLLWDEPPSRKKTTRPARSRSRA